MRVQLWCSTCHTAWTEPIWKEWQKCPFLGCGGELRSIQPSAIKLKPKAAKPSGTPLLDAAEPEDPC